MNYEIICIHRRVTAEEPHDEIAVIGVRDKYGKHLHYSQAEVVRMLESNRHHFYSICNETVRWLRVIERRRIKYVMLLCRQKRIATNCLLDMMPCSISASYQDKQQNIIKK